MGRMLSALKQLAGQSTLARPAAPVAVKPLAVVNEPSPAPPSNGATATAQPPPLDPRYRDVVAAVLAQLAVRRDVVLLVAGFAKDGPRGGQLAALYPLLAEHVDGGLLVVDADRRNPSLADRFNVGCELGLDDVLTRSIPWQGVVRRTTPGGFYLLPGKSLQESSSGRGPKRISRKRFLTPFSALLAELRRAHRLVLVDTVLAAPRDMGDWAGICDAAIVVARLEATPRHQVRQAIRAMQSRGGQVLGCVLIEY